MLKRRVTETVRAPTGMMASSLGSRTCSSVRPTHRWQPSQLENDHEGLLTAGHESGFQSLYLWSTVPHWFHHVCITSKIPSDGAQTTFSSVSLMYNVVFSKNPFQTNQPRRNNQDVKGCIELNLEFADFWSGTATRPAAGKNHFKI